MRKLTYCLLVILILVLTAGIFGCSQSAPAPAPAPALTPAPAPAPAPASAPAPLPPAERLRVATTTSLYDTGLWGYLEPMFEEQYGVELDVMYAGTGKALEYGRRGDVDIVAVHSRAREEEFIVDGYGVERVPFAYNYFLIVGPSDDPAGIKGISPEEAFKKLMETGSGNFVSRGDDSGTHAKEKSIWEKTGMNIRQFSRQVPGTSRRGLGWGQR